MIVLTLFYFARRIKKEYKGYLDALRGIETVAFFLSIIVVNFRIKVPYEVKSL
jgi:hypothetical protein